MSMRLRKDNEAQISFDFLLGVTIFIMAFIFLFMTLPTMFTPFQSNSDELTMMADRLGSTLVEKKLTALDDAGEYMPGIIDQAQVTILNSELDDPDDDATKDDRIKLGLDDGVIVHHVQVIFQKYSDDGTLSELEIPTINKIDWGKENVGQSRRFVYLRDSTASGPEKYPGIKTIMVVRVW